MLGRELVEAFSSHNVTAWDKENLDITNPKQVEAKISLLEPDLIINAAAYTDVDACEKNKQRALEINGKAVGYLAQMATNLEVPLVQYSTDYVFTGEKEEGYREDTPNELPSNAEKSKNRSEPVNVYGATKALGEKLLREHTDRFYLIRISWLFGPGGDDFVDAMLNLAKKEDELTVVDDQHGKPTYASDLAKATKELVGGDKDFGIYHRTNEVPSGSITWFDFAEQIFEEFSKIDSDFEKPEVNPVSSEQFSRPAPRPNYSILRNTKLPPMRDYQDALEDYLSQKR